MKNMPITFHIITLFPGAFDSYLGESIIARAIKKKKIKVKFYNPRDFTKDKWKRVDQRPYGGGPGMVLEPVSVIKACEKAIKNSKRNKKIIFFSTDGKDYTNEVAEKFSKKVSDLILICGRYEGIDARVKRALKAESISIGKYVLTGGELPAMVLLDSISRRIPGVLGNISSVEEYRTSSSEVYTRPEVIVYKGTKYPVPKVLLSGHHEKIASWKRNHKLK
jgi:tRNA (guanine37-N1)-methyltransferase